MVLLLASCGVAWAEHGGAPAAEGQGEEGAPGLFNGTFADSLWTVVAFGFLFLVLSKVAWKPLLNGLNARQSHIENQLKSAEDSRQRAEHMLTDYKEQGHTLVHQATQEAQRHRQQSLEETREEVLALRKRAHEEIESARAAAIEDLWQQTGDLVLRVGSQVLGRTLTAKDNERLIDEALSQVRKNGGL
ncbi:MAG: ATP synthase F0 subunit B [Planctomycetes bacterium RBG_13_62_9]|nr:MAG: ATP synthase F0 subunit B [Planctomycetes bacterium RBG_13_62_9]